MVDYVNPNELGDLDDNVVSINRITKVVKGGRRLRFSALVIVGDHKGHVGYGKGKAQEVPEAIRKASENAKRHLINVPMVKTTIPHSILGIDGGGKVLLKPSEAGSGVAAGGSVRPIMELAGVDDITAKSLGSSTALNVVKAAFNGLEKLKDAKTVERLRGIEL